MKKRSLVLVVTLAASLAACSKAPAPGIPSTVPADWYQVPESASQSALTIEGGSEEAVEKVIDQAVSAQAEALEEALPETAGLEMAENAQGIAPKNLTRWHLGSFTTDFAVTAKGVFGALTGNGTNTVRLYWRKKQAELPKANKMTQLAEESVATSSDGPATDADVRVSEDTTDGALESQLNDAVQVAMAGGKIENESALRENLRTALVDFRTLTRGLDNNPGHEWWLSRFRLDLIISASGKVQYFTSIGGEARVRLEWHRIRTKKPRTVTGSAASLNPENPMRKSFEQLINVVAAELPALTEGARDGKKGFMPYTFRLGVGITAGGSIGIAKAQGTVVGQIYFLREAAKPNWKSSGTPIMSSLAEGAAPAVLPQVDTVTMVENGINEQHLSFAKANSTRFEKIEGRIEQVVYQVSREQLRKGLHRAGRLAKFMSRRAHRETKPGRWGVYEMRVAFDTSFTGKLPVATIGGTATAQVALFNEDY